MAGLGPLTNVIFCRAHPRVDGCASSGGLFRRLNMLSNVEAMMRSLFATKLYEAKIGDRTLLAELAHSIRSLAADDQAGRRWSREHRYSGYTSYASLNDLPKRDPALANSRSY